MKKQVAEKTVTYTFERAISMMRNGGAKLAPSSHKFEAYYEFHEGELHYVYLNQGQWRRAKVLKLDAEYINDGWTVPDVVNKYKLPEDITTHNGYCNSCKFANQMNMATYHCSQFDRNFKPTFTCGFYEPHEIVGED